VEFKSPNEWAVSTVKIGDWIKFICSLWEQIVRVVLGVKKPQLRADLIVDKCPRGGLLVKSVSSQEEGFLGVRMP